MWRANCDARPPRPRLGNVPHFHFSSQALNHLTEGPIREAPVTNMLRCRATAQEAAGRSQNYVNRAGDRAKTGATITPNIPISAFFRWVADESCFERSFIKERWAHLKEVNQIQTVGETRHCWFYHTWQLRTSIIARFASWNCPPPSHLALWLYHRVICGQITYTTLLTYCGSLFAFIHTRLHPRAQFTLSFLMPRWVPSVCLTMWAQTRLSTRCGCASTSGCLGQAGVDGAVAPVSPMIQRQCCANLRVSTHNTGTHTPCQWASQPDSRRFVVQHQRTNFPELCRLLSTKLFSWLHALCNLWVSQGAVWRGTWKSYNNKICSSLR